MLDAQALQAALAVEAARRHLPLWTDWGVQDAGPLIHSLGCTLITLAGQDLGWCAVAEVPAPRGERLAQVAEDVRSDSAWFDRATRRVGLLAEFERYTGRTKDLGPKVASLLLAQQRWDCPDALLLLAYWSVGLRNLPDHGELRRIARGGFESAGGARVPGNGRARIAFFHFVLQSGRDGQLRLEGVHRRGEA